MGFRTNIARPCNKASQRKATCCPVNTTAYPAIQVFTSATRPYLSQLRHQQPCTIAVLSSLPVPHNALLQPFLILLIHEGPRSLWQMEECIKVPVIQDVISGTPNRILLWTTGSDGCQTIVGLIQRQKWSKPVEPGDTDRWSSA